MTSELRFDRKKDNGTITWRTFRRGARFKTIDFNDTFLIDRKPGQMSLLTEIGVEVTDEVKRCLRIYQVTDAGHKTLNRFGYWASRPCYIIADTKRRKAVIVAETIFDLDKLAKGEL